MKSNFKILKLKLQKTGERLRHFLVSKTPQIKTLLKDIAFAGLLLWLVLSYLENASQGSVSDYLDPSLPFYFSAISFSAIIFLQKLSPFPQKKQTRQKPGKAQNTKTPQSNFLSRIFPGLTQKKKFLLLKDIFIASLLLNLAILYLEWASSGSAENLLTPAGITAFQFISAASLFLLAFLKQKENLRKASSKTRTIIDKSIDFIAVKLAKLLQTEYLFLASLALLAIINILEAFEVKTALTQSDLSEETVFLASLIAIATGAALIIKNRDKIDLDKEKEEEEKEGQKNPPEENVIIKLFKKQKNLIVVFLVFVIFLTARFLMFSFSGGPPDEYFHILSGIDLFQNGKLPNLTERADGVEYTRGIYISFLVGLFFSIFGKSIFIAKMIPILLGSAVFWLSYHILKKLELSRLAIYFCLLALSMHSVIIFNHFYIRGYIFIEFSLIFLVFLFLELNKSLETKKIFKNIYLFILILLINFVCFYFGNDRTIYIIPFSSLLGAIYIYLFKPYSSFNFKNKNFPLSGILNLPLKKKGGLIFCFFLSMAIIFYSEINKKLNLLLNGGSPTKQGHYNFEDLFLELNFFFFIFITLGLSTLFTKGEFSKKLFFALTLPLFMLHAISSQEQQVVRGMMYLLPSFFIGSAIGLDILVKKIKLPTTAFIVILSIGLFATLKVNYNFIFKQGYPAIKNEIGYHEYSKFYNYLKNNYGSYKNIIVNYNSQKQAFYNFSFDYKLDFQGALENSKNHYTSKEKNTKKERYTNTSVISEKKFFYNLSKNNKVCLSLKPYSRERFLDKESWDFIKENFNLKQEFKGFTIYCNN